MTGVEERLAELLRATAPPSEGVAFDDVERHVRHRRAVRLSAAGVAAVVVIGGTTAALLATSGSGHPEQLGTGQRVNLAGTVPWISTPPSPYQAPPAPTRAPATNARPCAATDVAVTIVDGDGAGGHSIKYAVFRNVSSSTCVLKGYPRVVATEPGHPGVTATDGSFFPSGHPANMRPGGVTQLGVETDITCMDRVSGGPAGPTYHHLAITLPGGGTIRVDDPSGLDVGCGVHLTRFFVRPADLPQPHDPLSDLQVSLEAPPSVAAGSTLVYVVDMTNPTDHAISLDRCPGYVEVAFGSPIKEVYELNCAPVRAIAAHRVVRFAMRLPIPADTPAGSLRLEWSLAAPFSVTTEAPVAVTSGRAAGVPVSGILRMTGGPSGASQPQIPGTVRFEGVSGGQSYRTKAPDGSFAFRVPPGRYTVSGSSPAYEDGHGVCRAGGVVTVPSAGVSGVVVACSRR
jgi:hypothetical protein